MNSCVNKLYVTCLDQTVRLHIRIDMMLPFKALGKTLFSIYNYIAVLEPFFKVLWNIEINSGWLRNSASNR